MVDREQFLVVGLVVLSSFIHALDGVIVKWISNLIAMEMTFWRMTIQTIINEDSQKIIILENIMYKLISFFPDMCKNKRPLVVDDDLTTPSLDLHFHHRAMATNLRV